MFPKANIFLGARFFLPSYFRPLRVAQDKSHAYCSKYTRRTFSSNAEGNGRKLDLAGFNEFLTYIVGPIFVGSSLFWLTKTLVRPDRKDIPRMIEVANEYTRRGMDTKAAKQCQKVYSLLATAESDTSFVFNMMLALAQHHILAHQDQLAIDAFDSASKLVAIMERDHSPRLMQKRNIFRTHAVALLEKADLCEKIHKYDKVLPAYYSSIASFLKQDSVRKIVDILTETSHKFFEYGHYEFPKELQQLSLEEEQFVMEYCAAYLKKIDFLTKTVKLPEVAIRQALSTIAGQYNTELSMDRNTVFHILAGLKLVYIYQGQKFVEKHSKLQIPSEVYRISIANPIKMSDPLLSFSILGPSLAPKDKNEPQVTHTFRRDVASALTPDIGPLAREIYRIRQEDRRPEVISMAERFLDVFTQIELMLVELESDVDLSKFQSEEHRESTSEMS